MFDGIFEAINDTVRSILFGPLGAVLNWLIDIVDIILTEISGFSFIDMDFVTTCYETCMTVALVILPLKLVYEWMWLVISNDVEKWSTKIFAVFQIIVILLATPPVLTQVGNGVTEINKAILAGQVVEGESSASGKEAGEGFAVTMLVATTSLESDEAQEFIEAFTGEEFDINERDDDDNYIYDFDFIMPMFVGLAMWIIIFFIGLQMASRQVSLAFFKIITPLCALSLTNKDNPTAFTVWKNNIIGPFLMNMVQIFLFLFMFKLIDSLGESTSGLAKLLFTLALLLVIIAIPNKVAAMVGGYNAGIMEGLSSMQSMLMMASSAVTTGQAVGSGVKGVGSVIGKGAGTMLHAPSGIAKMSGTAASHTGKVKDAMSSSAAHVREAMDYGGGVGAGVAYVGSQMMQRAKDKVMSGTGGVASDFTRSKREADLNKAFGESAQFVSRASMAGSAADSLSSSSKDAIQAQKESLYEAKDGVQTHDIFDGSIRGEDGIGERKFERIPTSNRLSKNRGKKERRFK